MAKATPARLEQLPEVVHDGDFKCLLPATSPRGCTYVCLDLVASFFGHASGMKPSESARCCEAWLIVVRLYSDNILLNASLKRFAIPVASPASPALLRQFIFFHTAPAVSLACQLPADIFADQHEP